MQDVEDVAVKETLEHKQKRAVLQWGQKKLMRSQGVTCPEDKINVGASTCAESTERHNQPEKEKMLYSMFMK